MKDHILPFDPDRRTVIDAVSEGFVLTQYDQDDNGRWIPNQKVLCGPIHMGGYGSDDSLEETKTLLWGVLDALGIYNSDHNSHRLAIVVVPQNAILVARLPGGKEDVDLE